jgi:hypothetical protein
MKFSSLSKVIQPIPDQTEGRGRRKEGKEFFRNISKSILRFLCDYFLHFEFVSFLKKKFEKY